jgi:hypothetical protein
VKVISLHDSPSEPSTLRRQQGLRQSARSAAIPHNSPDGSSRGSFVLCFKLTPLPSFSSDDLSAVYMKMLYGFLASLDSERQFLLGSCTIITTLGVLRFRHRSRGSRIETLLETVALGSATRLHTTDYRKIQERKGRGIRILETGLDSA